MILLAIDYCGGKKELISFRLNCQRQEEEKKELRDEDRGMK
jgi:hypothetical protein